MDSSFVVDHLHAGYDIGRQLWQRDENSPSLDRTTQRAIRVLQQKMERV